jgi:molybdopterin molybdotransferase
MLNAKEALDVILNALQPLGTITVSLSHSLDYALAEDIIATENIPSFDNTAMDGYAIRSADVQHVPVILEVVDEIAAGKVADQQLKSGQAMSITTGAKIPDGADAVVQLEWTEYVDETHIKILRSVPLGHNIRKAGGDIEKGSRVLEKGQTIRPQEIGVLASLGKRFVPVVRYARVAVLATGNELVELGKPLPEGKIRNSNTYVLQALIQQCNAEFVDLGIAHDDHSELTRKITEGLKSDVLITSGGVSVGKYDLVIDVLKELGVDIKFWKVNIKPGMPLAFGTFRNHYVFGLPGNPVSTVVTFFKFVKPALLKMMGNREFDSAMKIHARLLHEIQKTDDKRHFVRGILESRNGAITVRSSGSQVSNVMSSLTKANCLIILPEEKTYFAQGDNVEVELL